MHNRTDLRQVFYDIAGKDNVYYEPPENIKMQYPCIRYKKSGEMTRCADNIKYLRWTRYEVTVIDKRPDSPLAEAVSNLPHCSFINTYVVENIHHTIYQIFV